MVRLDIESALKMQHSPQPQNRRQQKDCPACQSGAPGTLFQSGHVFPPGPIVKACRGSAKVRGIEQIIQRANGQSKVPSRLPAFLQQLRPGSVPIPLPGLQPEAGAGLGCSSKSNPAVHKHGEQPGFCLLLQPGFQTAQVIDGYWQYFSDFFIPGRLSKKHPPAGPGYCGSLGG